MLRDIAGLAVEHPGVRHQLAEIARQMKFRVRVALDKDFELFFPLFNYENYLAFEERHARRVRKVSAEWATRTPRSCCAADCVPLKGVTHCRRTLSHIQLHDVRRTC